MKGIEISSKKDVLKLEKEVISDRKKINKLNGLIKYCAECDNVSLIINSIKSIYNILLHYANQGDLVYNSVMIKGDGNVTEARLKLLKWFQARYDQFRYKCLLKYLYSGEPVLMELCLHVLMDCARMDCLVCVKPLIEQTAELSRLESVCSSQTLGRFLLRSMLCSKEESVKVINLFRDHYLIDHDDVQYFTFHCICEILRECKESYKESNNFDTVFEDILDLQEEEDSDVEGEEEKEGNERKSRLPSLTVYNNALTLFDRIMVKREFSNERKFQLMLSQQGKEDVDEEESKENDPLLRSSNKKFKSNRGSEIGFEKISYDRENKGLTSVMDYYDKKKRMFYLTNVKVSTKEQLLKEEKKLNSSMSEEKKRLYSQTLKKKEKCCCQLLLEEGTHEGKYSQFWLSFLQMPNIPNFIFQLVLLRMNDYIIPNFKDPFILNGFIIDSFNRGGYISLLAIKSLFTLMITHNLVYPDFYKKLYSIIEPGLFFNQHREEFCHLLIAALKSSHLPQYLVAAFAKKLARTALSSPPYAIIYCITLIYRLILLHPEIRYLIHREGEDKSKALFDFAKKKTNKKTNKKKKKISKKEDSIAVFEGIDPFDNEVKDPEKSNAMESTLWEFETLSTHYHPSIAAYVDRFKKFISEPHSRNLPAPSKFISLSYDVIFYDALNDVSDTKKKEKRSGISFTEDDKIVFNFRSNTNLFSEMEDKSSFGSIFKF